MNELKKFEGLGGAEAWSKGIEEFPAFEDYVFSDDKFISSVGEWAKNPVDALLLHGNFGSGKSELAKRLPVYMERNFQYSGSFYLIDCADPKFCLQRDILNKCSNRSLWGTPFFLLEEAEQLTARHQVSMRHVIQEHSSSLNIVLTTNEIDKIDPGIRSRSVSLKVKFPDIKLWVRYVRQKLGPTHNSVFTDAKILDILDELGCSSGRDVNRVIRTIQNRLSNQ